MAKPRISAPFDDGQHVVQLQFQIFSQAIEINLIALFGVDGFQQTGQRLSVAMRQGFGLIRPHPARAQRFGFGFGAARDQPVHFIDQRLKRRVFAIARMMQRHVDLGQHPTGILLHHDDPIGEEDGLLDIVRDHQDGFRRNRFGDPQLQQFTAQRLGAQHIQRAERFVEAEQVRLHRHRAGEAHLLPHAARQLARISFLETIETHFVQ